MFQKLLDMYVQNRIDKTYLEKAVKLDNGRRKKRNN